MLRRTRRLAAACGGALTLLAFSPEELQAQTRPTPVVVAVDTSRSLTAAELSRVAERLATVVGGLDAATPVGLLAFDDEPRWVVAAGSSPAAVAAALPSLRPQGDSTLLNDALFAASRALADGGVVLLVSDGRDERSAVTVEDIARRSEASRVRVLTLGIGRSIETLALRRLALVTDGRHLGLLDAAAPEEVAAALRESAAEVAATRPTIDVATPSGAESEGASDASTQAGSADAAADAAGPADVGGGSGENVVAGRVHPGWIGVLLAVAALAGVAALLARRRRGDPASSRCERCGDDLPAAGAACRRCAEDELHRELADRQAAEAAAVREVSSETVIFDPPDDPDALEKTRVLTELAILLVRQRGEETRAFVLPTSQAISIGRGRQGNSLTIADSALSARHLKIVPDGGRYFVVDLDSTNGTWIDGERIRARELTSGTVLRAGQVEIELKSKTQPLVA